MEYFMPQELFGQLSNSFFVHSGQTLNMGPAAVITQITKDSLAQVTAVDHGFSTGTKVTISTVLGMTQINQDASMAYTITVVDNDNFTLDGIDTTDYSTYTSGGLAIPVTNTVTGLRYLQGQTVVAVGDNCLAFSGIVPATGQITLTAYANKVTVGIPYTMTVQPTNPALSTSMGSTRGQRQKLRRVTFSLYQSIGGYYGTDLDHMHPIPYGSSSKGKAPSLFTGEVTVDIDGDWDDQSTFYVRQSDPFPFTLRGLIFRMEVNQD
jgi:hypothetical protein